MNQINIMSIRETLLNLGIQQLNDHYKYRNVFVKSNIMINLLEIANDIWCYLVNINLTNKNDLALFIHDNLRDEDIKTLFWIFKQCKCCVQHRTMLPTSLNSLELINFNEIPFNENCACKCNKACCYLYKSYHYNKYHIWI